MALGSRHSAGSNSARKGVGDRTDGIVDAYRGEQHGIECAASARAQSELSLRGAAAFSLEQVRLSEPWQESLHLNVQVVRQRQTDRVIDAEFEFSIMDKACKRRRVDQIWRRDAHG